jgi:hypothetical protein
MRGLRKPYKRRAVRYCGLCQCGEHAWGVLTKGYVTFVSPEDAHHLQLQNWYVQDSSPSVHVYAAATGGKDRHILLHRQILGGAAGIETDHRDGDGLNNRRKNLRPCSRSENQANSRRQPGTSGFRGVCIDRKTGRWIAQLANVRIGTFVTPEEAACAYDRAAIECYGEFATLNFPEGLRHD